MELLTIDYIITIFRNLSEAVKNLHCKRWNFFAILTPSRFQKQELNFSPIIPKTPGFTVLLNADNIFTNWKYPLKWLKNSKLNISAINPQPAQTDQLLYLVLILHCTPSSHAICCRDSFWKESARQFIILYSNATIPFWIKWTLSPNSTGYTIKLDSGKNTSSRQVRTSKSTVRRNSLWFAHIFPP